MPRLTPAKRQCAARQAPPALHSSLPARANPVAALELTPPLASPALPAAVYVP